MTTPALLTGLLAFAALAFGQAAFVTELPTPRVSELPRVDRDARPGREAAITAAYVLMTKPHPTLGDAYVIATDQTDASALAALARLAEFHHGLVLRVADLGHLRTDAAERDDLISRLRKAGPRFVAMAPRTSSFTEEMVVGVWRTLTALDRDGQLPVFPGYLVAPDEKSLVALVARSMSHRPVAAARLAPFVIGQVLGPEPYGLRSLQKVRIMRDYFAAYGSTTASLVTLAYSAVQLGVAVAPAPEQWETAMAAPGKNIEAIPGAAQPALARASLVLMFGHGNPGTVCSMDIGAFRGVDLTGKVVMCGDCFSAAPPDSFALEAVADGAVMVYAHMRENAGFPHLFPVLEGWMNGLTAGEAYQRQLNALLALRTDPKRDLASGSIDANNRLLYVVIGDPAVQPFAANPGAG